MKNHIKYIEFITNLSRVSRMNTTRNKLLKKKKSTHPFSDRSIYLPRQRRAALSIHSKHRTHPHSHVQGHIIRSKPIYSQFLSVK